MESEENVSKQKQVAITVTLWIPRSSGGDVWLFLLYAEADMRQAELQARSAVLLPIPTPALTSCSVLDRAEF